MRTRTGPDVQLTTFTDWKQVAQWYAKLQGERMTVDDSVRKKAEELTKGADTPTEKGAASLRFRGAECALREHLAWSGALSAALGLGRSAEWLRRL